MADQPDAFGAELRRRRTTAGWSLAMLAQRVHYSKGHLGKIETGTKLPGSDLARRCDAVLEAGGRLVALAGKSPPDSPSTVVAAEHGGEMWVMSMAPDGSSWLVPMARREALATGAASLFGLSLGGQGVAAAAEHGATVTTFRALFEQIRQLGQTTSPSVVLPTVIAQTHTLRGLANAASSPAREELLRLAARYAEYAGWMAQEAGDDRAALWWTRIAVETGTAAGDGELATYALIRQALITLYRDDAAGTIDLARQAQADPRMSRRVRGLAALREAQGHALACDYDQCRRALDRAAELLDAPENTAPDGPVMGSASVAGASLTSLVTGWCLHDLGRPQQAAEILDEQFLLLPDTARRAYARFGARRALAYLAAGEVEHAGALSRRVLDAAELVDSATVRHDLRRLAQSFGRWRTHHSVRDVYPRLSNTLRTPAL
ncbi:Helix-turn-helix domain-containing protein [Amycolatopsis tolypomycina]|uniref:Helix-turn-helix domain-containing protein n=1 Tax=Amycolatopsis tolypomycina TaxID=208445 RepID=A0A1H4YWX6_9PSEU|nr:helix-turn-helix transcriptional regulator [Amycolatopsis tolypomycina]SED22323.1 Helix-turn-helix domain-containing protein [Amycolatopsis tolypomycina]